MRIIAGEHRGRRLEAPPGQGTRPMLDRVREALFSTLGGRVDGARVLDLFAGSGSLSLEALSRGAASARAIEQDPRVLAVLKRNAETLRLEARLELVRGDASDPITWNGGQGGAREFDLVFLDPPYPWLRDDRRARVLEALARAVSEHLSDGLAVLHVPPRALCEEDLPGGLRGVERVYGNSSLWYVEKQELEG